MPTYILLSTLTPEGRQTLHKNPDRLEEVNKEIAALLGVAVPTVERRLRMIRKCWKKELGI